MNIFYRLRKTSWNIEIANDSFRKLSVGLPCLLNCKEMFWGQITKNVSDIDL